MMKNSNVGARGFISGARIWNKVASNSVTNVLCNKTFPLFLLLSLILPLLPSCSDDLAFNSTSDLESDGLVLRIPNAVVGEFEYTRAANDISEKEGQINDLWIYVFKKNGSENTYSLVAEESGKDIAKNFSSNLSQTYQDYKLNLTDGTYKIYLLGNVTEYSNEAELKGLNTISAIENLQLSFTGALSGEKLPMACLSAINTTGNFSATDNSEVTINSDSKTIYADMSFLCSKVRYTILFDNTQGSGSSAGISASFGDKVVDFNSNVEIKNIADKEKVGTNVDFDTNTGNASLYPRVYGDTGSEAADLTGDRTDWTENKRAWQGIVYLPENNKSNEADKTTLTFTGKCLASNAANAEALYSISHEIALVPEHSSCTDSNKSGNHGIKRGRLYDLTFKVASYEGLDVTITESDWTPVPILADFVHTYLELDKTEAKVTSLKPADFRYSTDGRGGVKFICEATRGSNNLPLFRGRITKDDEGNDIVRVLVNSNLNPDDLEENDLEGEGIECFIQAGNIKKKIVLSYDIQPFFNITPEAVTLNWTGLTGMKNNDNSNMVPQKMSFSYETNLGGFEIFRCDEKGNPVNDDQGINNITSSLTSTYKDKIEIKYINDSGTETSTYSYLNVYCEDTSATEGSITFSQNDDPGKVAHHYFKVSSKKPYKRHFYGNEVIMVTIIPDQGDYRVYFRAINDYQNDINNSTPGEFLDGKWDDKTTVSTEAGYPVEGGDMNWIDWWSTRYKNDNDQGSIKTGINSDDHNIYVYGQIGETGSAFSPTSWNFLGKSYDDGNPMTGDTNHPGWYFKDIKSTETATHETVTEYIGPGSTLFIFNARKNSYELHRCSHHMDPGVPLFNYEDREGWYLYDPTRDPYYTVYDDKPVIEDVQYIIHTPNPVTRWERTYGVQYADNGKSSYDDHVKYTMYGNVTSYSGTSYSTGKNGTCSSTSSDGYYTTYLKFKAPQGDYAKNINIISENKNGVYRIYFRVYKDTKGSWIENGKSPYVYLFDAPGMTNDDWKTSMTDNRKMKWLKDEGEDAIYYYDIPYGYHLGKMIIRCNDKQTNNITLQYPQSIIYPAWNSTEYDAQGNSSQYSEKYNTIMQGGTLFGGENFQKNDKGNVEGWFDGRNWYKEKPKL